MRQHSRSGPIFVPRAGLGRVALPVRLRCEVLGYRRYLARRARAPDPISDQGRQVIFVAAAAARCSARACWPWTRRRASGKVVS